MSRYVAIVLSAGSGNRMKSDIPKQYLSLSGYPVIYHSLKALEESNVDEVVLVVGEKDAEYCKSEIVDKYHLTKVKKIVRGGAERYDSVYAGLCAVESADYVLIHDGARPLLDKAMIERCMEEVKLDGACVVGMPVKDTIKIIDEKRYAQETPDRNHLWLVQTPQTFSYEMIYCAYTKLNEARKRGELACAVTDDAMVVEQFMGKKVRLIQGSYENIKITTPEDLAVAELFLEKIQNIS